MCPDQFLHLGVASDLAPVRYVSEIHPRKVIVRMPDKPSEQNSQGTPDVLLQYRYQKYQFQDFREDFAECARIASLELKEESQRPSLLEHFRSRYPSEN